MSKMAIRRAFESQMVTAADTAGVAIVAGKTPLDSIAIPEFFRLAISYGRDLATEIGQKPRIQRSGRFHVGCFSDPRRLEDRNDQLCEIVRAAFPYDLDLVRDGIRVNILETDDGQCIMQGSYLYAPVYVNFMVWEAVNG